MNGVKVKEFLQVQYGNYVKDLETLTNIDSGNGDPEGTDRAARFVAEKLSELGATLEYRTNPRSTHLIARVKGKGSFRLLMIAHIDTVFKPSVKAAPTMKSRSKESPGMPAMLPIPALAPLWNWAIKSACSTS